MTSTNSIPTSGAALATGEQQEMLGTATGALSQHTLHPEAQWFPRAGLGLFIHWGIASVAGNLDLSWGMIANTPYDSAAKGTNKLTPHAYWALADRFNPEHYDPDRWLAAAAKAGFQYAVLTAMHHDGYTLWPSRFGDLGVQSKLKGRDLVAPYVDACRRHGLKVGLYLSPPDWRFDREHMSFNYRSDDQIRFPGRPHFDQLHQMASIPCKPPEHDRQRRQLFRGRAEELLTRYGKIDLLWFDGGDHDDVLRDRLRALQPHIVLNSRSCNGDYDCTECSLPERKFAGWFETCHCWQASDLLTPGGTPVDVWGYLKQEQYKSTAWMLESLVRLRTWGGNLLVNVGPRPDGEMPGIVYDRLAEVADWMSHSRRSVIDVSPGPYPERSDAPITIGVSDGQEQWYVHFVSGAPSEATIRQIPKPHHAMHLKTRAPVAWQWSDGTLRLSLDASQRTPLVDVVVIHWDK